jgi:hypothetical protein
MRSLPLLFLALFVTLPVHAWTRAADERIAKKAASIAPADLRMLIEQFESDYKAGIDRAREQDGSDLHRYFVAKRQGRLRENIAAQTDATISMIRKGRPMRQVIERLGVLAHLVADANNPFNVANSDPALNAMKADFEHYLERRLTKIPTVFYGLEPNFRVEPYFDRTFARSASFYPVVRDEYFRSGERRTSSQFDDRSTAFGVASVSYSRSVTDLVNLYFHIWREAGGDVRASRILRRGNLLLRD